MRHFYDYDVYVFDCDGVLLDSNSMKIDAMAQALSALDGVAGGTEGCLEFFKNNFGLSREHHIDRFFADYIKLEEAVEEKPLKQALLSNYTQCVEERYYDAPLLPMVETILPKINGACFVASGTEAGQLTRVLEATGLCTYFLAIFGAPDRKHEVLARLKTEFDNKSHFVMVGDAAADYQAARANDFDFFGLTDFSNTPDELRRLCNGPHSRAVNDWCELVQ